MYFIHNNHHLIHLFGTAGKLQSLNHMLQVSIFTEEVIRSGSAASLSALLNRLDPVLRNVAHLGRFLKIFHTLPILVTYSKPS